MDVSSFIVGRTRSEWERTPHSPQNEYCGNAAHPRHKVFSHHTPFLTAGYGEPEGVYPNQALYRALLVYLSTILHFSYRLVRPLNSRPPPIHPRKCRHPQISTPNGAFHAHIHLTPTTLTHTHTHPAWPPETGTGQPSAAAARRSRWPARNAAPRRSAATARGRSARRAGGRSRSCRAGTTRRSRRGIVVVGG